MTDKPADTVFLHCLRCMQEGTHQHLDVILMYGELLIIACGSHRPPMHVCSVRVDSKAIVFTNPFQETPVGKA